MSLSRNVSVLIAAVCATLALSPVATAEGFFGEVVNVGKAGNDRSIVRYFKVSVASTGRTDSTWVGNEQAVQYEGTQSVSWGFQTREIYEYGEFAGASAYLSRACYGRRKSTCSPTKIQGGVDENVDLVEDPRTTPVRIACSRSATSGLNDESELAWAPSSGNYEVVGFGDNSAGFAPIDADLRGVLPDTLSESECPGPEHWISTLENSGDSTELCEVGLMPLAANASAYEQTIFPPREAKFRKSHDPFSISSTCSQSLGLDHDGYASREHTTAWTSNWSVRFVPLKESKLERGIEDLKKLR